MSDEFPLEAGLVEERRCSSCKRIRECTSTRWAAPCTCGSVVRAEIKLRIAVIRNLAPIQRGKAPKRALRWRGGAPV